MPILVDIARRFVTKIQIAHAPYVMSALIVNYATVAKIAIPQGGNASFAQCAKDRLANALNAVVTNLHEPRNR